MNFLNISSLPYRPCVGIMLCNQSGGIFAGKRFDSYNKAWQMPQGGIEDNEDPQGAALRELEEETSIPPFSVNIITVTNDWIFYDLPHRLIPKLWGGRFRGQKQIWFLMQFFGSDDMINIKTPTPEFSDWCWMPASDLLDNIVPFKRDTYRRVIREFKCQIE